MRRRTFTNMKDYQRALLEVPRDLDREMERVAVVAARELTTLSREILQREVYDIPEKVGPTGRKQWVRTYELIENEWFIPSGYDVYHQNLADHAIHRFRYGTGGRPARPPQQPSQWFRTAILRYGSRLRQLRRQGIADALSGGI